MARASDFLAMTPKTVETKIENGTRPPQNRSAKETEPRDDPRVEKIAAAPTLDKQGPQLTQ